LKDIAEENKRRDEKGSAQRNLVRKQKEAEK
jgi:hypothetical protein